MRRFLDAPQRPSQPSQRDDLLFLFFAQDIAHVTERNLSASSMSRFSYLVGRFSGVHLWPVLGVPRGQYQRNFSWTQDEVQQLWTDLIDAMDEDRPEYFLGSIVFHETREDKLRIV